MADYEALKQAVISGKVAQVKELTQKALDSSGRFSPTWASPPQRPAFVRHPIRPPALRPSGLVLRTVL